MKDRVPARATSPPGRRWLDGRGRWALPLLALLLLTAFQVQGRRYWGQGGWRSEPLREGLPVTADGVVDHNFTFCRLLYTSVRREQNGHGWNTDYPGSDYNFLIRLPELTTAKAARWHDGQPGFAVVRASQDELFQCPFLFMSDVGTVGFSDAEVLRLRDYLLKGGFIWVDDFWGEWAWTQWAQEIGRVLPNYPIVDVQPDDPLMNVLYEVKAVPQIPSIQWWNRNGRTGTSERQAASATPHLRAIFDPQGRPLVIMTHNTDIADGWEREGEDDDFFYQFSPEAYALGINVALYAMSR